MELRNNDSLENQKVPENAGKHPDTVKSSKSTSRFGKGNPGKPKGAVNKNGKLAKEAIAIAAQKLGGVDRLVEWAREAPRNEYAFWTALYPKLIPVQVEGPGENGSHLIQTITRRIIDTKQDG